MAPRGVYNSGIARCQNRFYYIQPHPREACEAAEFRDVWLAWRLAGMMLHTCALRIRACEGRNRNCIGTWKVVVGTSKNRPDWRGWVSISEFGTIYLLSIDAITVEAVISNICCTFFGGLREPVILSVMASIS